MKFLLFLAIVFILAIVFGLIDISPLLSEVKSVDGPSFEGFKIISQWF